MADELPSDAKIQAFLESQVNKAEDLTLLSRTILKDGLAKKFKLSAEQRELLDSDAHYKKAIKGWINDAVAKKQEAEAETRAGPSSEAKKQPEKKSVKKVKPSEREEEEEEEDIGAMSEFSSLEDDDEPKKKKARKSKGPPTTTTTEEGSKKSKTSTKPTEDALETKLKKLKGLVMACGTRKQWKKLYEEARCQDDEAASDEQKTKARKGQIGVVERVLLDLGMTQPFSKAKAAEIQQQKEIKEDLETIQVANTTERSTTRGGKARHSSSKTQTSSPETEKKAQVVMQAPPEVRKFNRSLADFAAELNED